jgi:glycosyltransferase involved in cell wall biosynthesis
VLATDLALAPWGWVQRQRRVETADVHPSLAASDLHLFQARFPRRLGFSPELRRELRRTAGDFDVVHVHNLWQFPQYVAYTASRRAGVPYVISPHGALDPYLRRRGRLRKAATSVLWQREMLAGAALLHVTTEAERDRVADVAPQVPRAVVPCGIYADDFSSPPEPRVFRDRRLGGYRGPLIVFLGRITQKKGVDVLIRAFGDVRREVDCRLAIVGPDDEGLLPGLVRLVRELGLERHVEFVEPVYGQERLAALSSADAWALSSHTENFGIAVIEAMAAGCAVVVSPGVSLAGEVAAADAGVVAKATPAAFAQGLLGVLGDDRRRTELRLAAPGFAARYDWSAVAPRLAEMYRSASET